MTFSFAVRAGLLLASVLALSACGRGIGSGNIFGGRGGEAREGQPATREARETAEATPIWDLFRNTADPNTTVEVNKYLWQASLEVLNFLPIQSVDPFSGVFVTGFGVPPGGGTAYRATVYVQDPSLDARSLKVSLVSRAGPVAPDTARAVEDAILTRARQLRVRDGRL
jgi:Domain of unknown function (DUF3576)